MQASKIEPKKIYAVNRAEGLARFYVAAVTTTRTGKSASEYSSTIQGRYIINGRVDQNEPLLTVMPDDILGPYEEYEALMAQKEAEDKAKRESERHCQLEAIRVANWLRSRIGLDPLTPDQKYDHRDIIQPSYGHGVQIDYAAVQQLLKTLEKRAFQA